MRVYKLFTLLLTICLATAPRLASAQSIDPLFQQGNAAQNAGNYPQAEAIWHRVIQLDPKYVKAYNNLGIALRQQGKLDEAIAAYQKAIQLDPKSAEAYYNLGIALGQQGKLDEAIAAYQKVLRLPNVLRLPEDKISPAASIHAVAHNGIGYSLQQQGKLEEAITEYKQAIALDSKFETAQNNLQEAQRLLVLRQNPKPQVVVDDRKWLPSPQDEPLVGVLRSVVRIIAKIPTGNNIGAGWVVKREGNKAWIVTNRHVVTDAKSTKRPSEKIELEFYSEPPKGQFPLRYTARIVQIAATNDPVDLALLEVTGIPDDIKPLPMFSGRVGRTTLVRVIGHPSNGGSWSSSPGEISNILTQEQKLQIAATLAEGNSGGPVIDQKNRVVGLMVEILDPSQQRVEAADSTQPPPPATGGFGFAYRIDIVTERLRSWKIP